jgi:hypothetical protein
VSAELSQLRNGVLFPSVAAMVARDEEGFVLISGSGARSHVRGRICADIEDSLALGAATPGLARLALAHPALGELAAWLATPAVPLTRYNAVRLDGFDTLFLELLGRCNERCVHCYADSAPSVTGALDRDLVLAVIDEAAAAGFRRVQFTGGDPLLCEFLPEAVAHAAARGVAHIEIFTNGLALTPELLDQLAPHRPTFAFSFYSTDPQAHDRVTRTPGSHRRTLAAIRQPTSTRWSPCCARMGSAWCRGRGPMRSDAALRSPALASREHRLGRAAAHRLSRVAGTPHQEASAAASCA